MPGHGDDPPNIPGDVTFDPLTHGSVAEHCFAGEVLAITCIVGDTCTPVGHCAGPP
jgi:hypothetical protein